MNNFLPFFEISSSDRETRERIYFKEVNFILENIRVPIITTEKFSRYLVKTSKINYFDEKPSAFSKKANKVSTILFYKSKNSVNILSKAFN